jgi:SAM-dependent methyltransferase
MNRIHQWYCASAWWRRHIPALLSWATQGVDLTDADVLELGSGPGLTTDWLAPRSRRLTTIDSDRRAATALQQRLPNVEVHHGDATDLPFSDRRFDIVVCFTMLHHVRAPQDQDALFRETARVLRAGGIFAGSDGTGGPLFRLGHVSDVMVLVEPVSLPGRLVAAGFQDPVVEQRRNVLRWNACTQSARAEW